MIDYNKELNCKCKCGSGLQWKRDSVIMVLPCEHLFHLTCIENITECPLCHCIIEKKQGLFDQDLHPQRFADILSVSYYNNMCANTTLQFIDSFFDIVSVLLRFPFLNTKNDGKNLCESIFTLNNITMKVKGLDKIKQETKKVYICNHVSHIEFIILYYLLGTGFLASTIAKDTILTEHITNIVPLLTIERGKNNNTVDQMKLFVDKIGSICIFPEGMMKHPDTLTRFRTGAFHVGYPIFPITIKHNDVVSDGYIDQFIYKLCGKRNINIDVHILGPYYPPFDTKSIEKIRLEMAYYGNMLTSRVSNRDIKD